MPYQEDFSREWGLFICHAKSVFVLSPILEILKQDSFEKEVLDTKIKMYQEKGWIQLVRRYDLDKLPSDYKQREFIKDYHTELCTSAKKEKINIFIHNTKDLPYISSSIISLIASFYLLGFPKKSALK